MFKVLNLDFHFFVGCNSRKISVEGKGTVFNICESCLFTPAFDSWAYQTLVEICFYRLSQDFDAKLMKNAAKMCKFEFSKTLVNTDFVSENMLSPVFWCGTSAILCRPAFWNKP